MPVKFCPNCGAQLTENIKFCPSCGSAIAASATTPPPSQNSAPTPPPAYSNGGTAQGTYYQAPSYQNQPSYNPQAQSQYGNVSQTLQPNLTAPMKVGEYILTFIIFSIPVVNIIMMFVWAFGSNVNVNKKNYSRAVLIMGLIGAVLAIIFSSVIIGALASIFSNSGSSYGTYYY